MRTQFNKNQQDLVQAFKTYTPKVLSIDADNTVMLIVDIPINKKKRAYTLLNKPFEQENLVKIISKSNIGEGYEEQQGEYAQSATKNVRNNTQNVRTGNSVTRSNPYRSRTVDAINGSNITLQRTTPGRFNKTYSVSNLRKSNSRFTLNHIKVSPLTSAITDFQDKDGNVITKGDIIYLLTDQNVSNIGKMNSTKNSTLNRNQVYKVTAINKISNNNISIVLKDTNGKEQRIQITRNTNSGLFQTNRISKKWIRWNKKTRNVSRFSPQINSINATTLPVAETMPVSVRNNTRKTSAFTRVLPGTTRKNIPSIISTSASQNNGTPFVSIQSSDWEVGRNESYQPYYYNKITGVSQWERPPEFGAPPTNNALGITDSPESNSFPPRSSGGRRQSSNKTRRRV